MRSKPNSPVVRNGGLDRCVRKARLGGPFLFRACETPAASVRLRGMVYRFENFVVDPVDRRLLADGAPVELNARYLDALILLLRDAGRLVSKDRFMAEVWAGIPVTDEALTQCIRTLRRALGDSASEPRFIETVPKHGYRFIVPVETIADVESPKSAVPSRVGVDATARRILLLGSAGMLGAGLAGLVGGVLFGFAGAGQGTGAASVLVVLVCITVFIALAGGAGVSLGIAAVARDPVRPWRWAIAGGAFGGFAVGAIVKLLGLDAFDLLLGRSPGDITGAIEGFVLGAAVGAGLWWAGRGGVASPRRAAVAAAIAGAVSGVLIPLFGGRLMAGSLDLLARTFPASRLRLDPVGALFGEHGLGRVGEIAIGGVEGALFAACLAGAMAAASRSLGPQAGRSGGASNADA